MTKATILLGAEAIKSVYMRALESKRVDSICLSSNYSEILSDWFDSTYAPRFYDGSRQLREVLRDQHDSRVAAKLKPVSCAVRFVTGDRSETDLLLTETWAALISYNSSSAGVVVIEDIDAVRLFKYLFEASWSQAKL